jgi:GR25 family glycosyltransferase involved in LPS biosynthesis
MEMEIYNIPLYYISFTPKEELENKLKEVGFTNINHFKAIDGKKMDPKELVKNNIITIRSYNDLLSKRTEHIGISSLGAIGCTMSHHQLWKKCAEDLDSIIIVEDDADINKKLSEDDVKFIETSMKKENSCVISPVYHDSKYLWGLQFYICNKGMCNELIKDTFPIDVQTDAYIYHLAKMNRVNIDLKYIYGQKIHVSSIQDLCVKCFLPNNIYIYLFFFILLFICIMYYFIHKCTKSL